MNKFCFILCMILGITINLSAEPVNIIFDTDMAGDVDDVGALAILHQFANSGEAKILACMGSSKLESVPKCIDVVNTFYGRPDIPIGTIKDVGVYADSKYATKIAEEFPHSVENYDKVPPAYQLYREILANQPDQSVVIVTVGFLTNMSDLLLTKPDEISDLTGVELVKKKVKQWVCMGARFPEGREYNIYRDTFASIHALDNWPTEIVFSGFEIGKKVKTGSNLKDKPKSNPVRQSYLYYNNLNDRESWDQTAVYYAVRGLDDLWTLSSKGIVSIQQDGTSIWKEHADGNHVYLIEKEPPEDVAKKIEDLMLKEPQ